MTSVLSIGSECQKATTNTTFMAYFRKIKFYNINNYKMSANSKVKINKCRTCLNDSKRMQLLTKMATEEKLPKSYGELLKELSNINIMDDTNKEMPQSICVCCIRKLKAAHAFVQQAQEANDKLWSMLCGNEKNCLKESQIDILEIKIEPDAAEYNKEEIPKWDDKSKIKEPAEGKSTVNTIKEIIFFKDSIENNLLNLNTKNCDSEDNDGDNTDFPKINMEFSDNDESISSNYSDWQDETNSVIEKEVKHKKQSNSKKEIPKNTDEDLPISCDQCDKVFPNSRLLHHHQRLRHVPDDLKVQCPYCPAKYKQQHSMYRHLREHHKNQEIEKHIIIKRTRKYPKKFACEQCTSSYTKKNNLLKHAKNKHSPDSIPRNKLPEKRFLCTICGSKFDAQSNLNIHIRRHTGEKPYPCDLCDRTFYRHYEVQVHRRSHTGEKPYQCTLCEKAFDRSFRLQIHMRSHTNERPYKCTECDKAFKQSKHLNIHKRTHTGEKPFKCEVCENAYTQKVSLRLHQAKHQHF